MGAPINKFVPKDKNQVWKMLHMAAALIFFKCVEYH